MRLLRSFFLFTILVSLLPFCQQKTNPSQNSYTDHIDDSGTVFYDRGLDTTAFTQLVPYQYDSPDSLTVNSEIDQLTDVLATQKKHLRSSFFRKIELNDSISLTKNDLLKTTEILSSYIAKDSIPLETIVQQHFDLYKLSGDDSLGNVLFTGYFTPVMKVRTAKDSVYKYPFYKFPGRKKGTALPERSAIDFKNILKGRGLEIAWSNNLFDNFTLQVQGSGIVEFEDNTRQILAYNGKNGHPYSSIGKYLIELGEIAKENISLSAIRDWLKSNPNRVEEVLSVNKSYVFFKLKSPTPIGAASVPLTADYSVAVDTDIIPLGSTLLAEVPVLDDQGTLLKHDYRLLFAQDRGGAIKGTGRIDLYCGIGKRGIDKANSLNHYGRIWLLSPKNNQ